MSVTGGRLSEELAELLPDYELAFMGEDGAHALAAAGACMARMASVCASLIACTACMASLHALRRRLHSHSNPQARHQQAQMGLPAPLLLLLLLLLRRRARWTWTAAVRTTPARQHSSSTCSMGTCSTRFKTWRSVCVWGGVPKCVCVLGGGGWIVECEAGLRHELCPTHTQASICTEVIRRLLQQHGTALTAAAAAVAELDCLCGFAAAARELGYCRPQLVRESVVHIMGGALAWGAHAAAHEG
jgi:hypothetical protein